MKKLSIITALLPLLFLCACGGGGGSSSEDEMVEIEEVQESDVSEEAVSEELYGAGQEITEDMRVFFVNLNDGDVVNSPFVVEMGVEGMVIEPAGRLAMSVGHHHILINSGFLPTGEVIPMDENNLHFGDGDTQTTLELEPGEYTLTLQFGDGLHQSYGEAMSATISVSVQ